MTEGPAPAISGCYREYSPHPALRDTVRAFFSFGPRGTRSSGNRPPILEVCCEGAERARSFADAGSSIVFERALDCDAEGMWHAATGRIRATIIGPISEAAPRVGQAVPAMVGVYLRHGQLPCIADVEADEITDAAVRLEDIWGSMAQELESRIVDIDDAAAIDLLEAVLLRRAAPLPVQSSVDIAGLTHLVRDRGGRITVTELADLGGVSRQHLTRVFHRGVGIAPKLYCRLARFEATLGHVRTNRAAWGQLASALGYSDQSHLIAELRSLSGLTPEQLARGRVFHPFVERARSVGRFRQERTSARGDARACR